MSSLDVGYVTISALTVVLLTVSWDDDRQCGRFHLAASFDQYLSIHSDAFWESTQQMALLTAQITRAGIYDGENYETVGVKSNSTSDPYHFCCFWVHLFLRGAWNDKFSDIFYTLPVCSDFRTRLLDWRSRNLLFGVKGLAALLEEFG